MVRSSTTTLSRPPDPPPPRSGHDPRRAGLHLPQPIDDDSCWDLFSTEHYNRTSIRMKPDIEIYDTTLRDGTQGEGVTFSVADKLRIAERLDAFGVQYIEGGWPGSNPKDIEFFEQAKHRTFHRARLAAFGSTRRKDI